MRKPITSPASVERRWTMHRSVETALACGWKGLDNGLEDFEPRSFAYPCELIGPRVRSGTLDDELVRDFLQYSIVSDWNAFQPLNARRGGRYPDHGSPRGRFRTLSGRITPDLKGRPLRQSAGFRRRATRFRARGQSRWNRYLSLLMRIQSTRFPSCTGIGRRGNENR